MKFAAMVRSASLTLIAWTIASCGSDSTEPAGPTTSGTSTSASTGGSAGTSTATSSSATSTGGSGGATSSGGSAGSATGGSSGAGGSGGAGPSGSGGAAGAAGSGGGGVGGQGGTVGPADAGADSGTDTWDNYAKGFFATFCVSCHNDDNAGVATRDYHVLANVVKEKATIACGVSPPATFTQRGCTGSPSARQFPVGNGPKPTDAQRDRLVRWIDSGTP